MKALTKMFNNNGYYYENKPYFYKGRRIVCNGNVASIEYRYHEKDGWEDAEMTGTIPPTERLVEIPQFSSATVHNVAELQEIIKELKAQLKVDEENYLDMIKEPKLLKKEKLLLKNTKKFLRFDHEEVALEHTTNCKASKLYHKPWWLSNGWYSLQGIEWVLKHLQSTDLVALKKEFNLIYFDQGGRHLVLSYIPSQWQSAQQALGRA